MKGTLIQPGVFAPDCKLLTLSSEAPIHLKDQFGKRLALIFIALPLFDRSEALQRFQARLEDFAAYDCTVIGISSAAPEVLSQFAIEYGLTFSLYSDNSPEGYAAHLYGTCDQEGKPQNAVLLLDEGGLVRRVYEAEQYPELPNPAMCIRVLMKISDMPRPWLVEDQDWHRGSFDADVTLIEYADYQCRPCFENNRAVRAVLADLSERICLVHRHLPIKPLHPLAPMAAEAAEAAGAQGRFWEMHDRLFAAEGALEREKLDLYAKEIGLDTAQFAADLDSGRFTEKIKGGFRRAVKNKIKLTPTLFINGILYEGPRTAISLHTAIDPILESLDALKCRQ
jgi:peroxiredoxin